jgi:hypothetical protein
MTSCARNGLRNRAMAFGLVFEVRCTDLERRLRTERKHCMENHYRKEPLDPCLHETFPATDPTAPHSPDLPAQRRALRLHRARSDDIGDLITRRAVSGPGIERLGAFLFLNHHGLQTFAPGNDGIPFGPV